MGTLYKYLFLGRRKDWQCHYSLHIFQCCFTILKCIFWGTDQSGRCLTHLCTHFQLTVSKAFSMSTKTTNPSILIILVYCTISRMFLILLPINLPFRYPDWLTLIWMVVIVETLLPGVLRVSYSQYLKERLVTSFLAYVGFCIF